MSIGISLLVIALGGIFTFAVPNSPPGVDLQVVGVVLMTVGGAGLFLRMSGYGPDNGIVTLPRWREWRSGRTRIVEEQVYDPMAEDPTVYRPAGDLPPHEQAPVPTAPPPVPTTPPAVPTTRPVVEHEERRYER